MQFKDPNPKDAVGIKKAPLTCVPLPFLFETGLAMYEGARKYGRHNYRVAPVRASVYVDALFRHMAAWLEGEEYASDATSTGCHHLAHAAACLAILRDAQRAGKLIDDRPPSTEAGWLAELNAQAEKILGAIPDAKAPYTQVGEVHKQMMGTSSYAERVGPPSPRRDTLVYPNPNAVSLSEVRETLDDVESKVYGPKGDVVNHGPGQPDRGDDYR